jgi:hypothetical protein
MLNAAIPDSHPHRRWLHIQIAAPHTSSIPTIGEDVD